MRIETLLNQLERKFGNWAVPGIIRYLAILFVGVFLMTAFRPSFAATLDFNYEAILDGQWWRVFTFLFAPQFGSFDFLPLLFLFFGTMLLFAFGDGLEQQWGVFRTNLFVFWGYLSTLIANWVFAHFIGVQFPMSGVYLGLSILFAFATYNPKFTLMLMLVIPCPIWVIAAISGGLLALNAISYPLHGAFIMLCISNYLVIAVPMLVSNTKRKGQNQVRRKRFERQFSESREPFHTCCVCGANDISNPEKDFRVGKDGNDYCTEHLPE